MYVLYSKVLDLYIGHDKHINLTLVKHPEAAIIYASSAFADYALHLCVPSTSHLFEIKEIK